MQRGAFTFADRMAAVGVGHKLEIFALFDQFPYTHHVESGVLLEKI